MQRIISWLRAHAQAHLIWRTRDGEQGSMLIVGAVAMTVLIASASFAVDLGRSVYQKNRLQDAVDLAALDAVRAVGDKAGSYPAGVSTAAGHATKLAQDALKANGFDTANVAVVPTYSVTLGHFDPTTRVFTAAATPIDAVRVSASTRQSRTFSTGTDSPSATALARVQNDAGIAVGSWLARVNTADSLLNNLLGGMLGTSTALTLVGYNGIASGYVTLGELRTQLGVGTVDQLLTTNVTLKNLLSATAAAMQARGDAAYLKINTLQAAASAALNLTLGDLIKVASGSGSEAADAKINVMQLVQMAAQVSNGSNAVDVDLSTASMGALGGLLQTSGNTVSLKVIEPPQIAIGPALQVNGVWQTTAKTAQVRALIDLRPLTINLGGIGNVSIALPIYAELASATASLTGVTCASPVSNSTATVAVSTSPVTAKIGNITSIGSAPSSPVTPATVADVLLLGLVGAKVTAKAEPPVAGVTNSTLTFGPNNPAAAWGWSKTKSVGGTSLGLGASLTNNLVMGTQLTGTVGILLQALLGSLVSSLLGGVLSSVTGVLGALDALTDPLFSLLGISLGGADVTVWDLHCYRQTLVG